MNAIRFFIWLVYLRGHKKPPIKTLNNLKDKFQMPVLLQPGFDDNKLVRTNRLAFLFGLLGLNKAGVQGIKGFHVGING